MSEPVLVLVRDLMFSSKITATAAAQGVAVRVVRDPLKLAGMAGRMLIADLDQEGAIEAAAAWGAATGQNVVGFVSHVNVEAQERAKAAGVTQIMARGRFVQVLEQLLAP